MHRFLRFYTRAKALNYHITIYLAEMPHDDKYSYVVKVREARLSHFHAISSVYSIHCQ